MDFFGIGPGEVLLIIIVALIFVGPSKITEVAKTLGRTVRAIKKAGSELTASVTREIDDNEKTTSSKPSEGENKATSEKIPPAPEQTATGSSDNKPNKSGGLTPTP